MERDHAMLSLEQIRTITHGAMEITEENGAFALKRFPTNQMKGEYPEKNFFGYHAEALASIRFDFITDATSLSFEYCNTWNFTFRPLFFFTLYIDGLVFDQKGYFSVPKKVGEVLAEEEDGKIEFSLPEGRKRVSLYFPELFHLHIRNVELSEGASIESYHYKGVLLAFGDSITQGHDVEFMGMDYIDQFARALDLDLHNFAIAGSGFRPEYIMHGAFPKPDLITVAFGTNDFRHYSGEKFAAQMSGFFEELRKEFPDTPVIVILPLWRRIEGNIYENGSLQSVRDRIRAEALRYEKMFFVNGPEIVPHHPSFFRDPSPLHPNDLGHSSYALHLLNEVRKWQVNQLKNE